MKKILMRSAMDPLAVLTPAEAVTQDVMNGNTGNMLFVHSITRTLLQEDTVIDATRTGRNFSGEEIDRINGEYDCMVIPLANAFRPNFTDELDYMTRLVRKLKIPCVVAGVGVQAKLGESMEQEFEFDRSAVNFIRAVLDKSAMIGVRGEVTAAYMKKLGFTEEKDFTVIGCPSMYLRGDELPLSMPEKLDRTLKVSVNRKINIPAKLHKFLYDAQMQFEDAMFVPQGVDDLLLLYAGRFIDRNRYPKIHETYPWKLNSPICCDGHEIGFTNVPSWLEFLGERDISFGSRIHGNVAALISGTPAYIFAPDARILELARYHNIPHMEAKDINKKTDILEIFAQTDLLSAQKGHRERFDHYLDFLEANGLEHVFGEERRNRRTRFDGIIESQEYPAGITALNLQSLDEQSDRLENYYRFVSEQYGSLHNLERYAKVEKTLISLLERSPSGMKKLLKTGIKRVVD